MIFLKLGGSLITRKDQPETVRRDILQQAAMEIAGVKKAHPDLRLLLGHGSGSFGHVAAVTHATHRGASTPEEWLGFAHVWIAAQRLNRYVIDALTHEGLPAIAFPPSAGIICDQGSIREMSLEPLTHSLDVGLLPVVFGDVAFDRSQGATIVSTETVFAHLARTLKPERVLLAGIEPGVYANYPESEDILPVIGPEDVANLDLEGAQTPDVTGGMRGKVEAALAIACFDADVEVRIFSATAPGSIEAALLGAKPGTLVCAA